jgi:anionic cell wall polymer biosynthesis LytR-Cps2A-Psr (LCP) family protein
VNGGGTSRLDRVNTLYYGYKRTGRFGPREVDCRALRRLRDDVATTLATEIDHYAMVRMEPFAALVDRIAGVDVDVPGAIVDPLLPAYFPDRDDYHLEGDATCQRRPKWCRSALTYVRSRHGTQGRAHNSDWMRTGRSQSLILDVLEKVRERGDGAPLAALAMAVRGKIFTDLPTTPQAALALYGQLSTATLRKRHIVVFKPARWAVDDASTPIYTFRLKLGRVRTWVNRHFEGDAPP